VAGSNNLVEARKAERRWKAAQKTLKEADNLHVNSKEKKKLETALHIAEVDRNYVKYCPLGWTYVSLYASGENEDQDGRREKGDPEMWKRVETVMGTKGGLDRLKLEMPISIRLTDEISLEEEVKEAAVEAGDEAKNESDDDFFE
jgi:hypothetical protein